MSKDKSKEKSNSREEESGNQINREKFPTEEQEVHEIVLNPGEIPKTERQIPRE